MTIDYKKMQVQRNVLLSIISVGNVNDEEKAALEGVVNLLEALLDEGFDSGACKYDTEGNVVQEQVEIADNDPNTMRM